MSSSEDIEIVIAAEIRAETIALFREMALAGHIGQQCVTCGEIYTSVEDIERRDPVCAQVDPMRFACRACFQATNT